MLYRLIAGLMLMSLGIMNAAFAEGQLSGQIVDHDGKPLAAAQITVMDLKTGGFADVQGKFKLNGIKSGQYQIKVTYLGYQAKLLPEVVVDAGKLTDLGRISLQRQTLTVEGSIVTASRIEKKLEDIPRAANLISELQLRERQPKTSAEALREEPGIFVQKTTHGGGSAIIRGLSSNRILILVDGIRLNNSTYRLGNHQYLTTVDYQMLNQIEVVRGPASVLYGSDALGGAINLITREATFQQNADWHLSTRLSGRMATADEERSGNWQISGENNRLAISLGSSLKSFGDLRRGANSDHSQLENSTNGRVQSPTGFNAWDVDGKLAWRISSGQQLRLALQHAEQKDVPRYDKYESGSNVLWLYSPQKRSLGYLQYKLEGEGAVRSSQWTLSMNRQQEGRVTQKRSDSNIENELDDVWTLGLSGQGVSQWRANVLTYGVDIYRDRVSSEASETLVDASGNQGITENLARGRYPDQASYLTAGVFVQDEIYLSRRLHLFLGGRYTRSQTAFDLRDVGDGELGEIDLTFQALTGSAGLLYQAGRGISLAANVGQAFRAPNLSDLAKLGESKGSTFEVPNAGLEAEKLLSADLGLRYTAPKLRASVVGYYARIYDLIASVDAEYRGSGQFINDGDTLKVKTKANTGEGFIRGVEASADWQPLSGLELYGNLTIPYGQNSTADEPIGKMPPAFGLAGLRWFHGPLTIGAYSRLAARQDRLSADDLDDDRIPVGGTPSWYTVNLRSIYHWRQMLTLQLSLENIFDVNYRENGSGINGPGRNLIVSLQLQR